MRRVFVGFSTPIGYSYENEAPTARNDVNSSPNPVLFGSMGLFTLYDEIWFACESLCPKSMRHLPYVKFLDIDGPELDLPSLGFRDEIVRIQASIDAISKPSLNDMFENGYNDGMKRYLGADLATDNHTHGLRFMGDVLGGNPGLREMIYDTWLIGRNKQLGLELALNPLTARLAFSAGSTDGMATAGSLGLAERVLTFGNFYDITGPDGPYHECVDEIRNDDLLRSFRDWMNGQRTRLDNQDIATVQADVDAAVGLFTRSTLRKAVRPKHLSNVAIKVVKDELMGKIPGGSVLSTMSEAINHNREAERTQWKAFIALTRDRLQAIR